MNFFSRQRFLRGVLTISQAVTILLGVLISGAIFLVVAVGIQVEWRGALSLFVLAPLILAAVIDSRCHILPDPLLFIATIFVVASYAKNIDDIPRAVLYSLVTYGIALLVSKLTSFGRGDVKLLAVIAAWFGNMALFFLAFCIAMCAAFFYSLVLMLIGRASLKSHIALGPWIMLGATIAWCGHTLELILIG